MSWFSIGWLENMKRFQWFNSWCLRNKLKLACDLKSLTLNMIMQVLFPSAVIVLLPVQWGPARRGGGPMSYVWILKRLVSVFIIAYRRASSMILGAQIMYINEDKGKLACLRTKDNILLTHPSCSSKISFLLFSFSFYLYFHVQVNETPAPKMDNSVPTILLSVKNKGKTFNLNILFQAGKNTSTFEKWAPGHGVCAEQRVV